MNEHSILREDPIVAAERQFWSMHAASRAQAPLSAADRKVLLRKLSAAIADHAEDFTRAIAQDFGWRSHDETRLAEVVPALGMIKHALENLDRWMRPEKRAIAFHFRPARNRVHSQPKGVVLIISPWNYPLQLTAGALTAALAAGNRVVVKPSETTPATAGLLKQVLQKALGADRVSVAVGGADMAEALCRLPFDHILFTGSTAVGKRVMQATSANLTPVTLELGGKSPAIMNADFDPALAAWRIARGKLLNAGQTCIAPDYALVRRDRVEDFVRHYREKVSQLYPRLIDNPDYTAIINDRHYLRLAELVGSARSAGARVVTIDPAGELGAGEVGVRATRKMLPILIVDPARGLDVMSEEVFGPILPVVPYDTIDEAITFVNARPRPLALYYFDSDRQRVRAVLERTVSGGASVNDTVFHFAQEDLPFGGVGASGMGAYHGQEGFRTFSHAKSVFHQATWTLADLIAPPYDKRFRWLMRMAMRLNRG